MSGSREGVLLPELSNFASPPAKPGDCSLIHGCGYEVIVISPLPSLQAALDRSARHERQQIDELAAVPSVSATGYRGAALEPAALRLSDWRRAVRALVHLLGELSRGARERSGS